MKRVGAFVGQIEEIKGRIHRSSGRFPKERMVVYGPMGSGTRRSRRLLLLVPRATRRCHVRHAPRRVADLRLVSSWSVSVWSSVLACSLCAPAFSLLFCVPGRGWNSATQYEALSSAGRG